MSEEEGYVPIVLTFVEYDKTANASLEELESKVNVNWLVETGDTLWIEYDENIKLNAKTIYKIADEVLLRQFVQVLSFPFVIKPETYIFVMLEKYKMREIVKELDKKNDEGFFKRVKKLQLFETSSDFIKQMEIE